MYETLLSETEFGKSTHAAVSYFCAYERHLEIEEVVA